eukprot:TRINITY_DN462_c0_g2_i1.p1 TRINITY_DN462_c0_g2~~TRINITY_DN462_c0_g2_i1.p1  ORF type:complete len:299 (-),score=51.52 TRINITY_DN462_c0_g2_i1:473-1369(-)
MAVARTKRARARNGEKAKVVGGLALTGLAACALLLCQLLPATTFVSTGTTPLTSTSRASSVTAKLAGPTYLESQTATSPAFAACVMLAAAAAARAMFAGQVSTRRAAASPRAVVRCATAPLAAPVPAAESAFVLQAPSSVPLIELGEPKVTPIISKVEMPTPITRVPACHVPLQTAVAAAAAPVEEDMPREATRSAFAGARAARVVGGVRFTASRRRTERGSKKSIRCYVAQKFTEVVPLKLAFDPSRLTAKMQAGLQVPSRVRKLYSRERKSSPASSVAGSFTGVSDLRYCAMIGQE